MTVEKLNTEVNTLEAKFYKEVENLKAKYELINEKYFKEFSSCLYDIYFDTTFKIYELYWSYTSNTENGTIRNENQKTLKKEKIDKLKLYCDNLSDEVLKRIFDNRI